MRQAENIWNSEVIFVEIKAMGYMDVPCCVTMPSPNVKYVRKKERFVLKLSQNISSSTTEAKLRW